MEAAVNVAAQTSHHVEGQSRRAVDTTTAVLTASIRLSPTVATWARHH